MKGYASLCLQLMTNS